jgi:hypothetical protein
MTFKQPPNRFPLTHLTSITKKQLLITAITQNEAAQRPCSPDANSLCNSTDQRAVFQCSNSLAGGTTPEWRAAAFFKLMTDKNKVQGHLTRMEKAIEL